MDMAKKDLDSPDFERFASYVLPSAAGVQDIIRYAKWARGGGRFMEEIGRLPSSWPEFEAWAGRNVSQVRILEVGCGSGYIASLLAQAGAQVIGIDPALAEGHAERPSKTYSHPDLELLPLKLDAVMLDHQESGRRAMRLLERKGRKAMSSAAMLKSRIGEGIDLVLSAWMEYGMNLTPAIREIGAGAIFYIKSSLGGTGIEDGNCGHFSCLDMRFLRELDEAGMDMVRSFLPGGSYTDHMEYLFDARCTSYAEPVAHAQFRADLPSPDFEFSPEDPKSGRDFRKVRRLPEGFELHSWRMSEALPYDVIGFDGGFGGRAYSQIIWDDHRYTGGKACPEHFLVRELPEAETRRVTRILEGKSRNAPAPAYARRIGLTRI